ncbi:competence protein ComFA [Amphibacillus marinus]|uniref:Competence protein ComFA n=1 Tax=Amphibacillus marinus TaxID=872970 RepID=A0A1H8QX89_9BACI|nr:helicase-related protein [Amphibacillus marinus]SEO58940.1 competence protein ComFA [Amphibacillus marinus]
MNKYAKRFSGRLLLKEELQLTEPEFAWLCAARKLIPRPSLVIKGLTSQCQRCGNKTKHLFGMFNCVRCQKMHHYCRYCIQMGRVMSCQPLYQWQGEAPCWPKIQEPLHWSGQLTVWQQAAAKRIEQAMTAEKEQLLVHAVCGAGKTEMLFNGIAKVLADQRRVCLATPRADVVRELVPRFQAAFPKTTIVGLYGGSGANHRTAQMTLTTTHQLFRYQQAFDVMIIDEVDAFPYHADPNLSYATNRALKQSGSLVYLTATPRPALLKKKIPTVFVPIRFHGHPLPVPTVVTIWQQISHRPPDVFWKWYKKRTSKARQLLIFTPTISQADQLAKVVAEQLKDKRVAAVHASDPDRIEKVQQFRDHQLDILVTTTILERGVTFPAVDVVVLNADHRVFDQAALVQIAGRAGRSPKDPTGQVVFIHNGLTHAIKQAVSAIRTMNKRAGL